MWVRSSVPPPHLTSPTSRPYVRHERWRVSSAYIYRARRELIDQCFASTKLCGMHVASSVSTSWTAGSNLQREHSINSRACSRETGCSRSSIAPLGRLHRTLGCKAGSSSASSRLPSLRRNARPRTAPPPVPVGTAPYKPRNHSERCNHQRKTQKRCGFYLVNREIWIFTCVV